MDTLTEYLDQIVDPTFDDYQRNPWSGRHAYLACVATFHSVDRAAFPKKSANLRHSWRKKSLEFLLVDMVAHHLKHVRSDDEKYEPQQPVLPISSVIFGHNLNVPEAMGLDHHNLHFVIRDAIKFVRAQAPTL